jgi:hypothetical protein
MTRICRPLFCYVRSLLEQSYDWNWKLHVVVCSVGLSAHLSEVFQKYTPKIKNTSGAKQDKSFGLISYHFICGFMFCMLLFNFVNYVFFWEPGQLSRYSESLRCWTVRERILVGARSSAFVQNGPGAPPASYTMGTGSFLGVQRPGRGVDHPPHLAPRLKKE